MIAFLCLCLGFLAGYRVRSSMLAKLNTQKNPISKKVTPQAKTQLQRVYLKAVHQTDSDRIRELNLLSKNQSVFLRLLKQTFIDYDIAIKQQRFIVVDRDAMPIAIFEYRDGTMARKITDVEDGIPLHLYKALLSSEALKQDYLNITST